MITTHRHDLSDGAIRVEVVKGYDLGGKAEITIGFSSRITLCGKCCGFESPEIRMVALPIPGLPGKVREVGQLELKIAYGDSESCTPHEDLACSNCGMLTHTTVRGGRHSEYGAEIIEVRYGQETLYEGHLYDGWVTEVPVCSMCAHAPEGEDDNPEVRIVKLPAAQSLLGHVAISALGIAEAFRRGVSPPETVACELCG